jgi:hypothetical protein
MYKHARGAITHPIHPEGWAWRIAWEARQKAIREALKAELERQRLEQEAALEKQAAELERQKAERKAAHQAIVAKWEERGRVTWAVPESEWEAEAERLGLRELTAGEKARRLAALAKDRG